MKPIKAKLIIIFLFVVMIINTASAYVTYVQENNNHSFFDKTVQGLLQEKITDDRITIEIEYTTKSKADNIRLNQEDSIQSLTIENFDPITSKFKLNILYTDGKSDFLLGKYISYVEIPVAARYIKFGEVIQASDLNNLRLRLDTIKNSDIVSVNEIVGMQAKKYIAMGSMIRRIDVARPAVIKNNDPVNIVYNSGAINLKTTGIALGSGAVGDMIKVKNGTSGTVLLGQIINKNTVQVSGSNNE